ncbi:PqqD family protein [Brevibacterium picturae]|uniref:Coenzyme PQQ synthesis protein D (PqqD) n=1 Tax=Brevibacterium picturae TaxID=260553 RepID=A0ABN2B466_9MICO
MTIQLKRGVVFSEADGQSVLTGAGRRAAYYRLNEVGTISLGLMLEGASADAAAEIVSERYSVGVDQVRADIGALVDDLRAADLIRAPKR